VWQASVIQNTKRTALPVRLKSDRWHPYTHIDGRQKNTKTRVERTSTAGLSPGANHPTTTSRGAGYVRSGNIGSRDPKSKRAKNTCATSLPSGVVLMQINKAESVDRRDERSSGVQSRVSRAGVSNKRTPKSDRTTRHGGSRLAKSDVHDARFKTRDRVYTLAATI